MGRFYVTYKVMPVQNFRWTKISPNALALYQHKTFAEFIFAHSTRCSPGSSGWSHQMNMPCDTDADRYLTYGPCFLVLACCTPFTAALATAMGEGYSSDDKGPAGSGKVGGIDIKLGCRSIQRALFEQLKTADDHEALLELRHPRAKSCTCKNFSVTKISLSKIIRRKHFSPIARLGEKDENFLRAKILCYTVFALVSYMGRFQSSYSNLRVQQTCTYKKGFMCNL